MAVFGFVNAHGGCVPNKVTPALLVLHNLRIWAKEESHAFAKQYAGLEISVSRVSKVTQGDTSVHHTEVYPTDRLQEAPPADPTPTPEPVTNNAPKQPPKKKQKKAGGAGQEAGGAGQEEVEGDTTMEPTTTDTSPTQATSAPTPAPTPTPTPVPVPAEQQPVEQEAKASAPQPDGTATVTEGEASAEGEDRESLPAPLDRLAGEQDGEQHEAEEDRKQETANTCVPEVEEQSTTRQPPASPPKPRPLKRQRSEDDEGEGSEEVEEEEMGDN